jgi:hypothetical protein
MKIGVYIDNYSLVSFHIGRYFSTTGNNNIGAISNGNTILQSE